jgi:hypothetical protein
VTEATEHRLEMRGRICIDQFGYTPL